MSKNPYASADLAHDRDLCKFDANTDAYEADWFALVRHFKATAKLHGFDSKTVIDIIERAAGDICDTKHQ